MNRGTEDYVKAIYKLQQKIGPDDYVSNNSLSSKLGHTAQTVNEMIKRLVSKGYVIYIRYKGTRLTEEGIVIAVSILRKHRLWELFLVKELNYSWKEVHEEAEQLEHVTSSLLESRLYKYLGQPVKCPHGNYIPSLNGDVQIQDHLKLDGAIVGNSYVLARVSDDETLLTYLDKIDFAIGDPIVLNEIDEMNKTYIVTIKEKIYTFGENVVSKMHFEEIQGGYYE